MEPLKMQLKNNNKCFIERLTKGNPLLLTFQEIVFLDTR